jgi:hypothetical protein
MIRVQHPNFDTIVYEVPADDLHEWLAACWTALDDVPHPKRYRRDQTPDTPGE